MLIIPRSFERLETAADFLTLYPQPLHNQPIYKLFEAILPEVKYVERLLPVGKKKLRVCQSLAH